ncbi:major facilitator superfamily domain-containing protein [Phyllosticta citribraziliensis]|uniref:Nitrate/nitrite transporter n=1 Tax=Phyllosticta citribraziliensis TaxID=989973 RepID=A0ABR1L5I0_9PEZI
MFDLSLLYRAPAVNPLNHKARSIPALNPFNLYGRVFFFSWFGFMIAFWSWYAFPPLLSDIIKADLGLSQVEIANSNIIALVATLLVRLVAGTACDRFGPRWTFAGCLLIGAVPTFLAGAVYNASGLLVLRFFVGILGGSFVPCQVWTTGFFDKNIVGTANSLTGGLGNSGGGITFFAMVSIYESLVDDGLRPHVAWRVSFVVPGILITTTAIALLLLCPDCPTGKWEDRNLVVHQTGGSNIVKVPGGISATPTLNGTHTPSNSSEKGATKDAKETPDVEASATDVNNLSTSTLEAAASEVIQKPTLREALAVTFSPATLVLAACYFCSFGAELSINSILSNYYAVNFPSLSLQDRGNWAAMFGLLNAVFRPLGGVASDVAYRSTGGSLWAKKLLLHSYIVLMGAFLIIIGALDPKDKSTMFGLVAGAAFFLEGANGLNFALVPHVHPYANGIVSGVTGAAGNLGGIVFAIIFRYHGKDYASCFWIIGVISMAISVAVVWVRPLPSGQVGGR